MSSVTQLTLPTFANDEYPEKISSGYDHSAFITNKGKLYTWGENTYGQLGNGALSPSMDPVQVGLATDWKKVVTGNRITYAIKTNGDVYAWGYNEDGRLGLGDNSNKSSPTRITSLSNIADISTGKSGVPNMTSGSIYTGSIHTLALATNGKIYSWGSTGSGYQNLGRGDYLISDNDKKTPTEITEFQYNGGSAIASPNIKVISTGENGNIIIDTSGKIYMFGGGISWINSDVFFYSRPRYIDIFNTSDNWKEVSMGTIGGADSIFGINDSNDSKKIDYDSDGNVSTQDFSITNINKSNVSKIESSPLYDSTRTFLLVGNKLYPQSDLNNPIQSISTIDISNLTITDFSIGNSRTSFIGYTLIEN